VCGMAHEEQPSNTLIQGSPRDPLVAVRLFSLLFMLASTHDRFLLCPWPRCLPQGTEQLRPGITDDHKFELVSE
jgi:hypothetical protein